MAYRSLRSHQCFSRSSNLNSHAFLASTHWEYLYLGLRLPAKGNVNTVSYAVAETCCLNKGFASFGSDKKHKTHPLWNLRLPILLDIKFAKDKIFQN